MTEKITPISIPWRTIHHADPLCLLERLPNRCAKLIYLDPPWDTADRSEFPVSSRGCSVLESPQSRSRHYDFMNHVDWLGRLIQHSHGIATHDGSIVVLVDPRIQGYLRLITRELLPSATVARIALAAPRVLSTSGVPADTQNSLLLIQKSVSSTWNQPTRAMTKRDINDRAVHKDTNGRPYYLVDLTAPSTLFHVTEWNGVRPPTGRGWRFSKQRLDQLQKEGRLSVPFPSAMPRLKVYADEQADIPVGLNWSDISLLPQSREATKLPGQLPLAVFDRLIKVATDTEDVVVDPMCGHGTTLLAAEVLGRRWIGANADADAVAAATARIDRLADARPLRVVALDSLHVFRDTTSLPRATICSGHPPRFVLHKPIPLEETRHYEFKEVKGSNPVGAITNTADEYAVAFLNREGGCILWGVRNEDRLTVGVSLNYQERDKVAQSVDNKLFTIRPSLAPSSWCLNFLHVYDDDAAIMDLWVVQLVVPSQSETNVLYTTGSGKAFVKTSSGKKMLSVDEIQAEARERIRKEAD